MKLLCNKKVIAKIIQNCLFSIISRNYILIHKTGFRRAGHIYIYIYDREDDAKELMLNDEPTLAVKRLSRALVLQPRNPSLYQQRAEGYIALGDFSSAIQNLKKALTLTQAENMEIKVFFIHSFISIHQFILFMYISIYLFIYPIH